MHDKLLLSLQATDFSEWTAKCSRARTSAIGKKRAAAGRELRGLERWSGPRPQKKKKKIAEGGGAVIGDSAAASPWQNFSF